MHKFKTVGVDGMVVDTSIFHVKITSLVFAAYFRNVTVKVIFFYLKVENVAKYQINRKRPGELYRNNLATIMEDMKPSRQSTHLDTGKKGGSDGQYPLRMLLVEDFQIH